VGSNNHGFLICEEEIEGKKEKESNVELDIKGCKLLPELLRLVHNR
jgi:hypothetical protein